MRDLGKLVTIDALTGKELLTHITDYLPAGWGQIADASGPVDSFGRPIVNHPRGLPGWSESDVAALRAAIAGALTSAGGETAAARAERQRTLGNFLGQALVRGIDASDLVRLDDAAVTPAAAAAVLDELRFAESVKVLHAQDDGYVYRPSVYGDEVAYFVEAQGRSLAELLRNAAHDDFCGLQSSVTLNMAGGQDYYVRLGGFGGQQGTYLLTTGATQIGSTPNDTCATALAGAGSWSGTTADNSGCVDESSCGGAQDTVDEWLSWTAPKSGVALFSTCYPETTLNTTLAVFDSCGGTELACNNDDPGRSCSVTTAPVVQGQTYYIRVAGFARSYGTFKVTADVGLIFADGFESGDLSAWN